MSLLNAFLRCGLLDTVMQQDVWIAVRTDQATGAGTQDDPWNGADENFPGTTEKRFDYVMQNKVPDGATVRLMPGTFVTRGALAEGGWQPKSGLRLIGAGMLNTVLRLAPAGPVPIAAVGNNPGFDEIESMEFMGEGSLSSEILQQAGYLDGFELSHLTIDTNLTAAPSGIWTSAVAGEAGSIIVDPPAVPVHVKF